MTAHLPRLGIGSVIMERQRHYATIQPSQLGVRPFRPSGWTWLSLPLPGRTEHRIYRQRRGCNGKMSNGKLTCPATSTTESGLGDTNEGFFSPDRGDQVHPRDRTVLQGEVPASGLGMVNWWNPRRRHQQASGQQVVRVSRTFLCVRWVAPGTTLNDSSGWSVGADYVRRPTPSPSSHSSSVPVPLRLGRTPARQTGRREGKLMKALKRTGTAIAGTAERVGEPGASPRLLTLRC